MAQFSPTEQQFTDLGFTSFQVGPPGPNQVTEWKKNTANGFILWTPLPGWYLKVTGNSGELTLNIETEENLLVALEVFNIPA